MYISECNFFLFPRGCCSLVSACTFSSQFSWWKDQLRDKVKGVKTYSFIGKVFFFFCVSFMYTCFSFDRWDKERYTRDLTCISPGMNSISVNTITDWVQQFYFKRDDLSSALSFASVRVRFESPFCPGLRLWWFGFDSGSLADVQVINHSLLIRNVSSEH